MFSMVFIYVICSYCAKSTNTVHMYYAHLEFHTLMLTNVPKIYEKVLCSGSYCVVSSPKNLQLTFKDEKNLTAATDLCRKLSKTFFNNGTDHGSKYKKLTRLCSSLDYLINSESCDALQC